MKPLAIVGWALFALDAGFVAMLFVSRNVGDDAAGRGMATGFAIGLTPVLAIFAAVLYFSQRNQSIVGMSVGVLLAALPALIAGGLWASNIAKNWSYENEEAQKGVFADARLTAIARAIDRNDSAAIRKLAREKIDFDARDKWDHTLLDHAVDRVLDTYGPSGRVRPVDALHTLLALGAPIDHPFARTQDLPIVYVASSSDPNAAAALLLLLEAGGDPNTRDEYGVPVIDLNCDLAKLKLLAEHGADLNALDPRSDRKGWTAIMNYAYLRKWPEAMYLLERGALVDYRAPDGQTLVGLLEGKQTDPGSTALLTAIQALGHPVK